MESELLVKEDEFHKENEKLEIETRTLMQKVNDVMKIQDNLIRDTFQTQAEINIIKKSNFKPKNEIMFQNELDEDNNFQKVEDNGAIKVYKAKLKSLVVDKEHLQGELKLKNEEIKKLQKDNQTLKEDKEKWFLLHNSCKNSMGKLEVQMTNTNAKLHSKDAEIVCLKKELEHLKKELKTANSSFTNTDLRLTRLGEEANKLKTSLKIAKDQEKELKESFRKQTNELTQSVKLLEKQKLELLDGFKKQMQLIDVLKRQKMHLEALKFGEAADAEYFKILNWKFD